ncbi:MAG: clostripain-related cysteine peptidase [Pseudomonadota bacterium]|nr:clostripain-related cysteine peptidase [Pseudomonadota bacterium]
MMGKVKGNSGQAKWTVMVYMAGDNNLDGAALRDMKEMDQVGSTKDVNVLVQLDRLEDKKTRRFLITKGGGYERDCLETFGETNTGDPKVLADFLTWSTERYPADRYFLTLWNQGRVEMFSQANRLRPGWFARYSRSHCSSGWLSIVGWVFSISACSHTRLFRTTLSHSSLRV